MEGSSNEQNGRAANAGGHDESAVEQGVEALLLQGRPGLAPFSAISQTEDSAPPPETAMSTGDSSVGYSGYNTFSQQFQDGTMSGSSHDIFESQYSRNVAGNSSSIASTSTMGPTSIGEMQASAERMGIEHVQQQQAATLSAIQSLVASQAQISAMNNSAANLMQQPAVHQTENSSTSLGESQSAGAIDMNHPFMVSLLHLLQQPGMLQQERAPPIPAAQATPSPQSDSSPPLDEARLALLLSQIQQAQQGLGQSQHPAQGPLPAPVATTNPPSAMDEARLALFLSRLEAQVRSQPPSPPDREPAEGQSLEPLRTFPVAGRPDSRTTAILSQTTTASASATVSSTGGEALPERKKRKYSHESFPQKLYRLIMEAEQEGNDTIVSFGIDGTSFQVHQPEPFEALILPRYFRHNKYASFLRQLLLYGFERVSSGPDKGCHRNPYFIKSRPDLLVRIVRDDKYDKAGKKKKPSK